MLPFQVPVTASSTVSPSTGRAYDVTQLPNPARAPMVFQQPDLVMRRPVSTEPTVPVGGLTQMQISALESTFADNQRPNPAVRQEIASAFGISPRVIQLWFQERRKRAKDEKLLESTRVEMILAAAGSTRHQATPHKMSAVKVEGDDHIVVPERPTTPPLSRPSSASPIKAQVGEQAPPATPAKTPTRAAPAPPVTPVQRITRDYHTSPTKYASPSEASYASLERSLAVAEAAAKAHNEAAAAAAAAYAQTPYTVVTPGAAGAYFYSPHPSQVHSPVYVAPGTPGFSGAQQAPPIASPFIPMTPSPIASHHPHGQYLISPIPLQRTYSSPGTMPELPQQPQIFSPLAAPSMSESKLAMRRRRQPPPAVRLRRSHSYSATVPGDIPSAPPYMMTFPTPSAPASGTVSPVKSMSVSSPDSRRGQMRRSKSVSSVQCQSPMRTRKSSIGGALGNAAVVYPLAPSSSNSTGSTGSWIQHQQQQAQEDGSKPLTPITPVLSSTGSLVEVDDDGEFDRSYKRVRRHTTKLCEEDHNISTDEDEPEKGIGPSVEISSHSRGKLADRPLQAVVQDLATLPSTAISSVPDTPVMTQFAPTPMSFAEPPTTTTASMHAAAAELFMSPTDCTNTASGISDGELAVLEQNQRLLMLTRQLDDLGIYGYGVLNEFT
ncbi:hypothetical protein V1525DRAFT_230153 [Lipomyces kononenkoae]|uniref:Uncharacterized protein n=1 Tax=Lipomyces kononenkoae TaxID=34357 RepID=A0ACC3TBZ9_LIPKO